MCQPHLDAADRDRILQAVFQGESPKGYLKRDFYGESSLSGVPFLDEDYTEDCGIYLIYGHNMNNGTMFAPLLSYAGEDFWRTHPVIRFDTLESAGIYEIVAVFYARAYEKDSQGGFRYYQYTDLSQEETFSEYMEQVREAALYETGVDAAYGDTILTLSTCSYHTEDGRFVVVARKEDGEWQEPRT